MVTVSLWLMAVPDGRETARVTHDDLVWKVVFNLDNTLLATASGDKTVRL